MRPFALPRWWLASVALVCLFFSVARPVHADDTAQQSTDLSDFVAIEDSGVPVTVDGRPILLVYARIGVVTPQERSEAIEQRILAFCDKRKIGVDVIHVEDRGAWSEILAGTDRIMAVTDADAKAAEQSRVHLSLEYAELIRQTVTQYRQDHTRVRFIWGSVYAALATVALVVLLIVIFSIRRRLGSRIEPWMVRYEGKGSALSTAMRLRRYLGHPLLAVVRALFWIFILALVQAYVTLVLAFFPNTRYTSQQITKWLFSELGSFVRAVIGYIPDLMLVVLICLFTSYLIKVSQYVFQEIRDERLTIGGFYPDWAEPTAKLVRILILAGAAIIVFPYLPGSNSPAFKGISVFVGVLLSLGSTSAVAHGVAGTILTYMRAFQVGDFVRIGNEVGEVIEKTLLVTRICTQKKEVVTIPNGTVLGGVVVNYSAEGRKKGVIFHTTVTIGYSAPWRTVHDLLVSAALSTENILQDPPPFVLQTALNDFYVAYELNAYTANPKDMQAIYSLLHQNIQDKFNEAGVEINSPHYAALRDGNRVTIPENYLPGDYKSPVFEIRSTNGAKAAPEKSNTLVERG